MKYFLLLLFLFAINGCREKAKDHNQYNVTPEQKFERSFVPSYNVEKDAWIRSVISKPPIKATKYVYHGEPSTFYTLLYPDFKLDVYDYKAIAYERTASTQYYCHKPDGQSILIKSAIGLPEHDISPETLTMIREICLNIK